MPHTLAKEKLISQEFFEELIPHIVSEFEYLQSHEQIQCLKLLYILAKNNLFSHIIAKKIAPFFVSIITRSLNQDVRYETLPLIGTCWDLKLITLKEAKCLMSSFLEMLNSSGDFEQYNSETYTLLILLGCFQSKSNLISKAEAEEFLLPVKKLLNGNCDARARINALLFFC